MKELAGDLIFIINNYESYINGTVDLPRINSKFISVCNKLNLYLNGYKVEYNHIQGKPYKPSIPLFAIRDESISPNMQEGVYIALLIRRNSGVYISLNQGTENKSITDILKHTQRIRRQVNDLFANYELEYKDNLIDNIDLTSNLMTKNKWRPKSYEQGNIKAIYYDKDSLERYPERFVSNILWFIELYRIIDPL